MCWEMWSSLNSTVVKTTNDPGGMTCFKIQYTFDGQRSSYSIFICTYFKYMRYGNHQRVVFHVSFLAYISAGV